MSFARAIRGVMFTEDGVVIDWTDLDDTRDSGLMRSQQYYIPATDEYAEVVDELVDAIHKALDRVTTDFNTNPPSRAARVVAGEDEDEVGPYDNPLERDGVSS